MSHISTRPLSDDQYDSIESLADLPISGINEAIQKTSSNTFGNKSFGDTGGGDVLGPATNTTNYIPQWNGANSKTLKDGINPATLLTTTLNSANIFVGNGSNVATGVALSGDASLSNTGVLGVNKTRLNVRNETGVQIASTKAVYVSGFNNLPLITPADNTQEIKHNVVGITIAPIAHEANGFIATSGQCDAETNGWVVGTELYLGVAGALTSTAPTSGGVRHVAIVTVQANYPTGKLLIYQYPEENYLAGGTGVDTIVRMGDNVASNKTSFRNYANTEVASINSLGQTIVGGHGIASSAQVVNVCYGTDAPPDASTVPEGTLFIKYIP